MVGVSLVGFSGSMIKDAVKDASTHLLSAAFHTNNTLPNAPVPPPEPIEEPEATKVLLGMFHLFRVLRTRMCTRAAMTRSQGLFSSRHVVDLVFAILDFNLFLADVYASLVVSRQMGSKRCCGMPTCSYWS